ncbi:hypothetical protein BV96_04677 [Sphingomonas paucimobilis]|nr:hypothetical protein BV96_04677 [Sphingomonas paucimobilis]
MGGAPGRHGVRSALLLLCNRNSLMPFAMFSSSPGRDWPVRDGSALTGCAGLSLDPGSVPASRIAQCNDAKLYPRCRFAGCNLHPFNLWHLLFKPLDREHSVHPQRGMLDASRLQIYAQQRSLNLRWRFQQNGKRWGAEAKLAFPGDPMTWYPGHGRTKQAALDRAIETAISQFEAGLYVPSVRGIQVKPRACRDAGPRKGLL